MRRFAGLVAACLIALPAYASEKSVEALLPPGFGPGWSIDGKVSTYTPGTLYRYIDGEAELYLPYGFEKAATARYVQAGAKGYAVVASIFKMGSLLDAFGIYSNYRSPDVQKVEVGAEGFADESQLMFYQGRYFVRLEASGAASGEPAVFRSCADAVSRNLPPGREKPCELDFVRVAGAIPRTERYYPSGLLGYGFFGRGLTAEVMVGDERAKMVVMLFGSKEAAGLAMDAYGRYLKTPLAAQAGADGKPAIIHVTDPLYKGTALCRSGRFIVGVTGLRDAREGNGVVEGLLSRLPEA